MQHVTQSFDISGEEIVFSVPEVEQVIHQNRW